MVDRPKTAFAAGVADCAPLLIGVFPFGVIAGIVAVEAGLTTVQSIAASPIIFAGAAQLATMGLIAETAAPVVIVLTALVINSRMAMYSAALSPRFRHLGTMRKALGAYLLTDQAFAMSTIRYDRIEESLPVRYAYYMGVAVPLWVTWMTATILGVLVGTEVPRSWALDFAIPLVFLALLFPAIRTRADGVAAMAGAVFAAVFYGLPLHLGLLAATATAIVAGLITEEVAG
jgi:4-azaleucine resistance transporter AzlC